MPWSQACSLKVSEFAGIPQQLPYIRSPCNREQYSHPWAEWSFHNAIQDSESDSIWRASHPECSQRRGFRAALLQWNLRELGHSIDRVRSTGNSPNSSMCSFCRWDSIVPGRCTECVQTRIQLSANEFLA